MDPSGSSKRDDNRLEAASGFSLRQAAEDAPHRLALVDGDVSWTFRQLRQRVDSEISRWIRGGVEPRRPVALVGRGDTETLIRIYVALELGLPLALLHDRATAEEHAHWVEVWSAQRFPMDSALEAEVDPLSWPPPRENDTLAIVRTSGTSGRPRGVRLSRGAFAASAHASASNLGWQDDDRWLLALPVSHVGGLSIVLRCLAARRTVVLAPSGPFDADVLCTALQDQRITLLSVVPTMLRRLLGVSAEAPRGLRAVLVGGGAASPSLLEEAAAAGWPVLTTYGCTEACSQVTTQPYGTRWRPEMGAGRPLPGQQLRIRGGRIEIQGPTIMQGFLPPGGEPITEDGWLRSGDMGHINSDGYLHVHGRADDVIIRGGENVSPLRVEEVLETHPSVAQACVFGVPDATWGQQVAAALVAAGKPPTSQELDAYARQHLAPYERPRQVAWLDALVLNGVGKVDRKATAELASPKLLALERS